jgi:predicted transcriptional regulator
MDIAHRYRNTMSEWIEALQKLEAPLGKAPKGFKTRRQIQEELGLSQSQTLAKIMEWKNRGFLETINVRTRTGQVVRPVPHYKLIYK